MTRSALSLDALVALDAFDGLDRFDALARLDDVPDSARRKLIISRLLRLEKSKDGGGNFSPRKEIYKIQPEGILASEVNIMKIAVTGGTGFVGRHFGRAVAQAGHEVVLVARGCDRTDASLRNDQALKFFPAGLDDEDVLAEAFKDCAAVAHCGGINREVGAQTYQRVHVAGTRHVVNAARRAGVRKIALMSFLRARPGCGSAYHESKWAAEEIVRSSGLDYTVLKCGVIYGPGDHMLNHLSHAFHTFPVFGFVGFTDKPVRPTAVADVVKIVNASLVDGALSRQTVAVLGPEQMGLRDAVRRVARVAGRRPLMFPMPIWFHRIFGWFTERCMVVPLVSTSQVRMLAEGMTEAAPPCDNLPKELQPATPFTDEQIRRGLPPPKGFGLSDLRCCHRWISSNAQ